MLLLKKAGVIMTADLRKTLTKINVSPADWPALQEQPQKQPDQKRKNHPKVAFSNQHKVDYFDAAALAASAAASTALVAAAPAASTAEAAAAIAGATAEAAASEAEAATAAGVVTAAGAAASSFLPQAAKAAAAITAIKTRDLFI
jgi:hypothetical protein